MGIVVGIVVGIVIDIKWIAIVTVLISIVGLDGGGNMGGNLAHIGGAIVGAWFALSIKNGHDITRPLNACIDAVVGLFNGRSFKLPKFKRPSFQKGQGRAAQTSNNRPGTDRPGASRPDDIVSEQELDEILKKIKVAGYDALTDAERDKLSKASRRREP